MITYTFPSPQSIREIIDEYPRNAEVREECQIYFDLQFPKDSSNRGDIILFVEKVIRLALLHENLLDGLINLACLFECVQKYSESHNSKHYFTKDDIFGLFRTQLFHWDKNKEKIKCRKFLLYFSHDQCLLVPQIKRSNANYGKLQSLYIDHLAHSLTDIQMKFLQFQKKLKGPFAYALKKCEIQISPGVATPIIIFVDERNFAEFCFQHIKHGKVSGPLFCDSDCLTLWPWLSNFYIDKVVTHDIVQIMSYLLKNGFPKSQPNAFKILVVLGNDPSLAFSNGLGAYQEFWSGKPQDTQITISISHPTRGETRSRSWRLCE